MTILGDHFSHDMTIGFTVVDPAQRIIRCTTPTGKAHPVGLCDETTVESLTAGGVYRCAKVGGTWFVVRYE